MDPSPVLYADLDSLTHLRKDLSAFSSPIRDYTPILPLQSQQLPMECIDGSLEYRNTANGDSLCIGQSSPAEMDYGVGSDIPRYLTLLPPIDLNYHQFIPTADKHEDASHKPLFENINEKNGHNATFQRYNKKPIATHSRRSSRSSNKLTSDESGIDKRERNRMAASKCRKKQKLANSELQERARVMSEQHNYLVAHKASLELKMINLKNELLLHGSCGCEPITDYLMQAAKKFVKGREDGMREMREMERREEPHERPHSTTARDPRIL
ncbi:hypothetical protein F5Y11DRAFT_98464 [Daldinia sp. FL1419]|nr:hypothetical protein F5Y11DRAFT_98464 [Daldinia sp. FL1419]